MKKLLEQLGISLQELADLLMTVPATVRSWVCRGVSPPARYMQQMLLLEKYRAACHPIDYAEVQTTFNKQEQEFYEIYCDEQIKKLQADLKGTELKLITATQQQQKALKRWHLGTNLPGFLPANQSPDKGLTLWLGMLTRKSALMLSLRYSKDRGKCIQHKCLKLQQKAVELKAALAFWEEQKNV